MPSTGSRSRMIVKSGRQSPQAISSSCVEQSLGNLARFALVDPGRIVKAVAEHGRALVERRPDQRVDMIGTGGRKQHRFGLLAERFGGARQQDVAHRFGAGGAARLAGRQRRDAALAERLVEQRDLRRFADALATLEGHEQAARARVCRLLVAIALRRICGFVHCFQNRIQPNSNSFAASKAWRRRPPFSMVSAA